MSNEFLSEIKNLRAELERVTAQRDAARAERNERDEECVILFAQLQKANTDLGIRARQCHDLRLKVEEYTQDKAVLYQCFQEAQAAANMWQAKHQEAQQAREALRLENSALNERVHELECLEAADAQTIALYTAALVEERDANEALYRQVADLQTSVNLASAVTFRLKERLAQETARADVERNCATFWYRKAAQNANL